MTPDEISNLKAGDRLMGPTDHKAEVIRRTTGGVEILWDDGGEKKFHSLIDPDLQNLTYVGPRIIEEPWLQINLKDGHKRRQSRQRGRRWLNEANLVLSAVIACATICYTIYAAMQWRTMKRQADDTEAMQAAHLTFEEFQATILPGPNFVVDVSVTLRNNGSTVADDIDFNLEWGTVNLRYKPDPEPAEENLKGNLRPTPNLTGPSLGPDKTRIYQRQVGQSLSPSVEADRPGLGQTTTQDVQQENEQFFITFIVSYNDIFGHGHVTTDCMTYNVSTKSWVSAPNNRQHN
jgi:hypothetical protein